MRTNIELDDGLISEARKHSKARTKRALVEEALATFIAVKHEELRKRTYRERLVALRDRLKNSSLRSDSRDIVRQDRESR